MTKLTATKTSYEISKIRCLPFINLVPSSCDAIYTVLKFAAEKLKSGSVEQSCIFLTFDQPLYAKAHDMLLQLIITSSEEEMFSKVILRLGGFHLLMSFMAAIGFIMAGSGLQELWSTIYAPNVAARLMTGHPYTRTLRAHFLTQMAMAKIIFDVDVEISDFLEEFSMHDFDLDEEKSTQMAAKISTILYEKLENLRKHGDTASLWVQYFHACNLMQNFVEAELTGRPTYFNFELI